MAVIKRMLNTAAKRASSTTLSIVKTSKAGTKASANAVFSTLSRCATDCATIAERREGKNAP